MSGSKSCTDFCADDFGGSGRRALASFALDQRLGDLRGAEHEVHRAGGDRASGHPVIVRFADVLRDDETALSLTAFRPRLPSAPVPESTTQTARAPYSRAREFNRKSKGSRAPCRACGFESRSAPFPSTER